MGIYIVLREHLDLKQVEKPAISPVGNIVGNIDESCMQRLYSDMRPFYF
jgi:hypothetical protein